jgi:hypothetical protein
MFGPKNVPKGVLSARPPAKAAAPFFSSVWHAMQPPALAMYSPRLASPCAHPDAIDPENSRTQAAACNVIRIKMSTDSLSESKKNPAAAGCVADAG